VGDAIKGAVEKLPFEVSFKGIPSPRLPQDELEAEYINVFDITPPCPLYESDYRSDELSRRDVLEELLRYYEHFDIKLGDRGKDYPDHLVAELEFMAFLAQKEARVLELRRDPGPYRRAQRDFLDRHLNRWVHLLDENIQRSVKEPFYKATSSFMGEFVRRHLSYLEASMAGDASREDATHAGGKR
jgi:DMSO reductase family type II enzyme chaperone